ncbi:uncharacterized protein LOC116015771 [Ipomoea triloba]|uniref:uncharacterized protein LOC116015771 n=1 Tax=Ipomoea triloba TaxID=35885 RepID=UPI00125D6F42|nr:uncharacterized protein LOC116015771 [Ipomoea triloba]
MQQEPALEFSDWRKLWSLKVPPNIRNFLWRCVRYLLPVKEVLRTKHVVVGGGCSLCSSESETIEHIFCECPIACQVWGSHSILHEVSFVEFVKAELDNHDNDRALRMAAIFWTLWRVRNDLVWNGKSWSVSMIKAQVDVLISSWKQCYSSPESSTHDHTGGFVAAYAGRMNCARDPYLAETMAAKEALTWLKNRVMPNTIVELDCLNFCTNFNSQYEDFSYIGLIIKQCRVIARDIGDVHVCHVKRSANHVAHVLARAAGSFPVLTEWDTVPPDCISDLLLL